MSSEGGYNVKGIIETLLFINEKPITVEQIKSALEGVGARDVKDLIQELEKEYRDRQSGMVISEIAGGYQMLSNPQYAAAVRKFYKTRHKEKLSSPALETLAIVAYKQPVTRADIELIRSVNSDGVTAHLLEKQLIKIVGRKDIPGRPYLYGTTKEFLEYFGLKSLEDLPRMEDFAKLQDDIESEDTEEDEEGFSLEEQTSKESLKEKSSDEGSPENKSEDADVEGEGSQETVEEASSEK